jgi:hypothetical protein
MTKTRCALSLVVAVVATAAVTAGVCLLPGDDLPAAVDKLIAEFRAHPSDERAARLAEVLNYGYASKEQGGQVLPLLLKPGPWLSCPYLSDGQINFRMVQPFEVLLPPGREWFGSSERFEGGAGAPAGRPWGGAPPVLYLRLQPAPGA